jgi:hypothetical protein
MMPSLASVSANCASKVASAMSHAAVGRPLHAGDCRFLHLVEHAQHAGEPERVALGFLGVVLSGTLHPVEVSAGAEALAGAGDDDDADIAVDVHLYQRRGQILNQHVVEGIVPLGAVQRDDADAAVDFGKDGFGHHSSKNS